MLTCPFWGADVSQGIGWADEDIYPVAVLQLLLGGGLSFSVGGEDGAPLCNRPPCALPRHEVDVDMSSVCADSLPFAVVQCVTNRAWQRHVLANVQQRDEPPSLVGRSQIFPPKSCPLW